MGDPFSVTGGIVGIAAFGITVCQGLVKYYKAWEGQSEEIKAILSSLEIDAENLTLLRGRLTQLSQSHSDVVAKVEQRIIEAQKHFDKLKSILKECENTTQTQSFKDKSRNVNTSIFYPLRRDTILNLQTSANEAHRLIRDATELLKL